MSLASDERSQVQLPLMKVAAHALGVSAVDGESLDRTYSDVILKSEVKMAINRLNPHFSEKAIATALREFERLLASVSGDIIVEKSQDILGWIKGKGSTRGDDGKRKSVKLIDFENPSKNNWTVAHEVTYKSGSSQTVRFDGVIYCNGIPFVVAEFKSNTSATTSWFEAATDLAEPYTRRAPALMATSLIHIATDGRELRYAGIKTEASRYQNWGSTDTERPKSGWAQVMYDWLALTSPDLLLKFAQDLILHVTDKTTSSIVRIVPRWPQAEAAPLAATRALDPENNKGLFDHFQGSGKTYAMAMAANIITRQNPKHIVILVVDRIDLLTQHRKDFAASDVRSSIAEAEKSSDLRKVLKDPSSSGIIITTVHRFDEAGFLSNRSDITVMVDEAHRTQEGTLGVQMRNALPNATLLGFTGTPLSEGDKNTYETFGSEKDKGRVIHRYSAADSVRDGTTIPLTVFRSEIVQRLDSRQLDKAYDEYAEKEELGTAEKADLASSVTNPRNLFKDPRRIETVSQDVAKWMREEILPAEYAAMLVVIDREACILYTKVLKKLLGADVVTTVISSTKGDPEEWAQYVRDPADEALILKDYRDPSRALKLLIVTSKLLTGFDAKNCAAVFIDKPLRRHTLFQAVTRANRTWSTPSGAEKKFGSIVDYCGITPHLLKAFDSSENESKITEFTTPEKLRRVFRRSLAAAEKVFGASFDWRSDEVIHNANEILHKDIKVWEVFYKHTTRSSGIWDAMGKDPLLAKEKPRLLLLLRILHSYAPSETSQKDLSYAIHGLAVLKLIYENTGDPTRRDLKSVELTAKRIQELLRRKEDPSSEIERIDYTEVLEKIRERLKHRMTGRHAPHYRSLATRLELFQSTHYEVDAAGARAATEDLTSLVKDIRDVDRIVGEDDADLDFKLVGNRIKASAAAVVNNPATALQDVLGEFHPASAPNAVETLSMFLDETVNRTSYRHLSDNPTAQKALTQSIVRELNRIGLLPKGTQALPFVNKLLEYVKAWML